MFEEIQAIVVSLYHMDYKDKPSDNFLEKCEQAYEAGMQPWEFVAAFSRLLNAPKFENPQAREMALITEMRWLYKYNRRNHRK